MADPRPRRLGLGGGVLAAVLLLAPAAQAKPMHIMSLNLCTDLLLIQMAPKSRIASLTHLAHGGVQALFPGADAGIAINHGSPEDIINQKPDLILAETFAAPVTQRLAAKVGARVATISSTSSFADIRVAVRQVGAAIGEPERAEALIRRMDAELVELAAIKPARRFRVVAWSGGNAVPGKDTLTNAIIEAAGADNIAAAPGFNYGTFDVEQLLQAAPDALLFGGDELGKPSLQTDQGQHRVVRALYAGRRIGYNEIPHTCGLPQSAGAARDLRTALMALPPRKPLF